MIRHLVSVCALLCVSGPIAFGHPGHWPHGSFSVIAGFEQVVVAFAAGAIALVVVNRLRRRPAAQRVRKG